MKRALKKDFSYMKVLFRGCQFLVIVGMIIQLTKLFILPQAFIGFVIYGIILGMSIVAEKKLITFIKTEVEREVTQITTIKDSMFSNVNIPIAIIGKVGSIKWSNRALNELFEEKVLIGTNIKGLFPESKIGEWMQDKQPTSKQVQIGSKCYELILEEFTRQDEVKEYAIYFLDCTEKEKLKVQLEEDKNIIGYLSKCYELILEEFTRQDEVKEYAIYFLDCTEKEKLKVQLEEDKNIIGYLCIDNVDEIMHSIEEVRRPMLLAIIDRKINLWFKERDVVVARIERDKYILVLSRKELQKMEETKFDILDEMRNIQVGNELPVTVSIGIGNSTQTLLQSKEDARIAFDLAQGRGGDQAIIKHQDKYTFYGGKTKEVEKSARVKVRIKAYAFKELLHEAEKVYIMGHKNIDMDCLGAAMGVYRGATLVGKKAKIILREPTYAIKGLHDRIMASKEYEDLFITPEEAEKEMNKDTLLVIVDTHRRSYVEAPELLALSEKVVVFDHHRKSPDYIEEAVLTYLEPFISSTCEMIAEILNYLSDKIKLSPIEADALLAGITIDTKNFVFKAGVRTFEAAAFLRRNGADSTRVQMLFQNDMDTYRARAKAIQMTQIWYDNMAVSEVPGNIDHAAIVAAQVADELLNIKGIKASFVFTDVDGCIFISARALGDTNVQRIMELLGGGGHLGIAGAQLKDTTTEKAQMKLKEAINLYFQEGESK